MRPVPYRISNLASRKLLANPQGSRDNGTKMIQWDDEGGPEQEWVFDPPLATPGSAREEGRRSSLQQVLGGGRQREYQDFAHRYDQGPPWAGISDQEALDRYHQVAPHLPPDIYQESAQEAFARMSPQERVQFGQHLRQRTRQHNLTFPDIDQDGIDDRFQDPRYLAQVTGRMHQEQPGLLGQLLSGGGGGGEGGSLLDNPLAKAALAGVTALAVKRMMSGR